MCCILDASLCLVGIPASSSVLNIEYKSLLECKSSLSRFSKSCLSQDQAVCVANGSMHCSLFLHFHGAESYARTAACNLSRKPYYAPQVVSWALAGLYRMHTVANPESFPEEAMSRHLALGRRAMWQFAEKWRLP